MEELRSEIPTMRLKLLDVEKHKCVIQKELLMLTPTGGLHFVEPSACGA
jgi:hypothetical protein